MNHEHERHRGGHAESEPMLLGMVLCRIEFALADLDRKVTLLLPPEQQTDQQEKAQAQVES